MPISRISFTECCVGFVFSSPAVAMYGTSVTCMLSAFCGPASTLSWRIASRNGSDSMSPTVPPISTIATSTRRRSRVADARFDLVGDVRNDLHRRAEVLAAALLRDDRLVDAAGREVVLRASCARW